MLFIFAVLCTTLAQEDFIDCVGQVLTDADCIGAGHTICEDWIGDGVCDNGFSLTESDIQMFLNCPKFHNDGGDCDAGGEFTCADASMEEDDECPDPAEVEAEGDYLDCWGQHLTDELCAVASLGYTRCAQWWSDGSCDGGQHLSDRDIMINWNCESYNYDGGDCSHNTAGPTMHPSSYPTMYPSTAPTNSPTVSPSSPPTVSPSRAPTQAPTTAEPTFAPTRDPRTFCPDLPSVSERGSIAFSVFWAASGIVDPLGVPFNGAYDAKTSSTPDIWARVEDGEPTVSTYDINSASGEYDGIGAGHLAGCVWVPAGTGAVEFDVTNNGLAYIFFAEKQIGGINVSGTETFLARLLEEPNTDEGGAWYKVEAVVVSREGVMSVSLSNPRAIPTCVNRKAELCNVWAQNPQMCEDEAMSDFCRLTCRKEFSQAYGDCVLAKDNPAFALFPFENASFQEALGLHYIVVQDRGGVSLEQLENDPRGIVLAAAGGDITTNIGVTIPSSVCAWIYPDGSVAQDGKEMTVVDASGDCSHGLTIGMKISNGGYDIYTGDQTIKTNQSVFAEEWQHVCVIFDTDNIQLYAQGALVFQEENITYNLRAIEPKWNIGARCGGGDNTSGTIPFIGKMNDVSFFDVPLTMNEANDVYEAEPNLTGFVLEVGKRVTAQAPSDRKWYMGTITQANNDTYQVTFDDGDVLDGITREMIRAPQYIGREFVYRIRELVKVNRFALGVWQDAIIRIVETDGLSATNRYTVEYVGDGMVETNVPVDRIDTVVTYSRNQTVRVRQCFWYEARIDDIKADGQFFVTLMDGDEANPLMVNYEDIKAGVLFAVRDHVLWSHDGLEEPAVILSANAAEDIYDIGLIESQELVYGVLGHSLAMDDNQTGR